MHFRILIFFYSSVGGDRIYVCIPLNCESGDSCNGKWAQLVCFFSFSNLSKLDGRHYHAGLHLIIMSVNPSYALTHVDQEWT